MGSLLVPDEELKERPGRLYLVQRGSCELHIRRGIQIVHANQGIQSYFGYVV